MRPQPFVMSLIASFVAIGIVSSVRADFSFPSLSWALSLITLVSSGSGSMGSFVSSFCVAL